MTHGWESLSTSIPSYMCINIALSISNQCNQDKIIFIKTLKFEVAIDDQSLRELLKKQGFLLKLLSQTKRASRPREFWTEPTF